MKSGNLGLEVTSKNLTSVLDHLFKTNLERELQVRTEFAQYPCVSGEATVLERPR